MRSILTFLIVAACHLAPFAQSFHTWEYDDAQPSPNISAYHQGIERVFGNGYLIYGSYSPVGVNNNFPFLTRLNDQGNELWVRNYDYFSSAPFTTWPGGSIFREFLLTRDGGFILEALGSKDWMVKFDAAGDTLWTKQYRPGTFLGGACTDELPNGNLLYNIGINDTSPSLTSPELVWTDSAGNPIDTLLYTGIPISQLSSVDVTDDHGAYMVGFDSTNNFIAARIDSAGTLLWDSLFYTHALSNGTHPRGAKVTPDQGLVHCFERKRGNSAPNNTRPVWEFHKLNPTGGTDWQVTVPDDFGFPLTWQPATLAWTLREDGSVLVAVQDSQYVRLMAIAVNGTPLWDTIMSRPPGYNLLNSRGICRGVENTNSFASCGFYFFQGVQRAYALGSDSLGDFRYAVVQGTVFDDDNPNCIQDTGEPGLAYSVVVDDFGQIKALTDANGDYEFVMGTGSKTFTVHPAGNNWFPMWSVSCPTSDSLTATYSGVPQVDTLSGGDFAMEKLLTCPLMYIDIGTPFIRYCSTSSYSANYCNLGSDSAFNAHVVLVLDSGLTNFTASLPFTVVGLDSFQIDLGNVGPGECGQFQFSATDACQMPFVPLTRCVEAHIYPDSFCGPPPAAWSGAEVQVEGWCNGNDTVWFRISNIGTAAMQATQGVWVVEDDILRQTGHVQLNAGEDSTFFRPANGATWTTMVAQVPGFPWPSIPRATVEACGTDSSGSVHTGFVTSFEDDDRMPWRSIDCQQIRAAVDPNDKTGFPTGVGPMRKIFANAEMEYLIRFQNTGTDTAFTVTIRDSLPSHLDLTSFISGVSSHAYSMAILPGNVVEWTFAQIMLPDSNVDEAGSHGFVKFRIMQQEDLPNGTRIENSAGIIFDYMPPVITNTAFHTIGELELVVNLDEPSESAPAHITVYPNPCVDHATFDLDAYYKNVRLAVYDLQGRQIRMVNVGNGNRIRLDVEGLPQGMHVFKITAKGQQIGSGRLLVKAR